MRRHNRGFSLLEVIAAVMLLALTFGALMKVAGSSLNLTTKSARHSQAALWARSKLDTVGQIEPLAEGHSEGRFDDTYRWRMDATPWAGAEVQSANLKIYKVDLDVLWGDGTQTGSARFSTLLIPVGPPVPASGGEAP